MGPSRYVRNASLVMTVGLLLLTGCGGSQNQPAGGKYKVALSNSFMGNDWRQNMENVVQYIARHNYGSQVDLSIFNTENSPQAQSASIDALAQKGFNAIIMDAASATALNDSVNRACKAGVTVVTFDQPVTADCAYKVGWDFKSPAYHAALWLDQKAGGSGNVVLDEGLAGVPISKDIVDGFTEAQQKYPGIKVVARYQGQFAEAPAAQAMPNILATQPKIDAVYTQGYCTVVVKAFQQAGRPLVPMYCQGFNSNFLICLQTPGAQCIANPSPPGIGAIALKIAVQVLDKQKPSKTTTISLPLYATDVTPDIGIKYEKIAIGKTAFPDLPPGLTLPTIPPGYGLDAPPQAQLKS